MIFILDASKVPKKENTEKLSQNKKQKKIKKKEIRTKKETAAQSQFVDDLFVKAKKNKIINEKKQKEEQEIESKKIKQRKDLIKKIKKDAEKYEFY